MIVAGLDRHESAGGGCDSRGGLQEHIHLGVVQMVQQTRTEREIKRRQRQSRQVGRTRLDEGAALAVVATGPSQIVARGLDAVVTDRAKAGSPPTRTTADVQYHRTLLHRKMALAELAFSRFVTQRPLDPVVGRRESQKPPRSSRSRAGGSVDWAAAVTHRTDFRRTRRRLATACYARPMVVLVTGGAGFIGSAVVRDLVAQTDWKVVNVDALTYASNPDAASWEFPEHRYRFIRTDICDRPAIAAVFAEHRPSAVIHLAAESHVDRSIDGPAPFIRTNVAGTATMLEEARAHWSSLPPGQRESFRFVHVSTDEVFGDLEPDAPPASEASPYRPSSPYAASKASSDHLARAWHRTWGLPVLVTNCSNNYGPFQFPEKLVPHVVLSALAGHRIPVYGAGDQVRDWLHVEDHARALRAALDRGEPGRTYLFGSGEGRRNLEVVQAICSALDTLSPATAPIGGHASLVEHVADRPGHDRRYAVDPTQSRRELGWVPATRLEEGLRATVAWYVENRSWWQRILQGKYRLERIGT